MEKIAFKYKVFFLLGGILLALDQWTKSLIHHSFRLGETRDLINSIVALTYVRNKGAAFSMLDSAPARFRDPFFLTLPCLALTVIGFLLYRHKENDKLTIVSLTLVAAGALGNLLDRLKYGFVVDFIDLHWKEVYHWPRFNVADSCIVIAMGLLFLQSVKKQKAPEAVV